jgi:hypothetical protein
MKMMKNNEKMLETPKDKITEPEQSPQNRQLIYTKTIKERTGVKCLKC